MSEEYWRKEAAFCREQRDVYLAERDSLRKEVERLSGKTGFCALCEGYAKEVERLRGALEEIRKGGTFKWKGSDNVHLEWYAKLAKEMNVCLTCMEKTNQADFCSLGCYLKAPASVKELIWKKQRNDPR